MWSHHRIHAGNRSHINKWMGATAAVLVAVVIGACSRTLAQPTVPDEPVVIVLDATATNSPTALATPTVTTTSTRWPSPAPGGSTPSALSGVDEGGDGANTERTHARPAQVAKRVPITGTGHLSDTRPVSVTQNVSGAIIGLHGQQVVTATDAPASGEHITESAEPATRLVLVPTPRATATPSPTPVPQATPDGVARTVQVPILMYHYLSVPPPGANIYRTDLSVPPDLFAAHLDRMLAEGYTTVSLYDFVDHLTQGKPLPEKPVIITFDDGYRDNFENAFPLLAARDMTATFFVVTDFMDEERPEYLTWDMVRAMQAGGMDIESHGRNHVSLAGKDEDYLVWQALGSLETIEYELGVRPRFVSYPAGDYDQRTIDIFASAHYWAGLTTRQGATHANDDMFQLMRVRVRNSTTPDELVRLLELDW